MIDSNGGPPLDDAPRLRVVRVHINDWVASTRGMSLDEEGFFWRFTCLFYDRMGDLPDDDAYVARAMSLDVRQYRRMKARMVAAGKIDIVGGRLSNARAEREINMYVAEYKRRSEAAFEREKRRRDEKFGETSAGLRLDFGRTSAGLRPEVQEKSAELPLELSEQNSEKSNINNECTATTVTTSGPQPSRARAFPKPKPKPKFLSEEDPHTPPKGGLPPVDQAFEDFWKAYPPGRKQDKGGARDTFRRIVTGKHRRGMRAKAADLIAAAARYAASNPDPEFVPMPTTWLNGGRWEDEVAKVDSTPAPVEGKAWGWWRGKEDVLRGAGLDRWRAAIVSSKPNGTWPWWLFGAPPGHPECLVPPELVSEYGYEEIYQGRITHA